MLSATSALRSACALAARSRFHVAAGAATSTRAATLFRQWRGYRSTSVLLDYPTHTKITMPALSPTMEQGNLASWSVEVGGEIAAGDVLAEIETDKATMEFECNEDGYLAKTFINAGEKDVPVGKLIAILVPEEGDVAAFADYEDDGSGAEAAGGAAKTEEAELPKTEKKPPPPAPAAPTVPAKDPQPSATSSGSNSGLGSPLAKHLARQLGFDLSEVSGSGPNGRVVESDVYSFTKQKMVSGGSGSTSGSSSGSSSTSPLDGPSMNDEQVSGMRKIIAGRLLESKTTIPHYYLTSEINLGEVTKLRTAINAGAKGEFKISVNDFVVKASALACLQVPEVNSSWQGDYIRQYNTVDVSVAVATGSGLITPIVKNCHAKGLKSISGQVKELAGRAREGKLQPHEYQGGTFTVSNLGMYDSVRDFCAIINPPQACILAVGGSSQKVIATKEGLPEVGTMMNVTLSCDHRVVDGAVGAQWLKAFKEMMEDPTKMLL
ncbi:hypothetical protein, variant [Sphaeroforma arctica JP610]|uniref:Acetyltransferase component of pyruvate dehydrogenase complex n=1 Tax=Sphaeroforma arctica JP610 TaxID=667725 RepID=A0A0L0FSS6_9EUKA|nr:hypothetical protein, variant [Sphaeroforma arctica JP610]KNC79018.1 hypothetical protein, variant [Sphaeroforma arctica JP610]|eukprot:XP_014152920.1 hypothetical protein, variant [Sphaeroforma arctica JP610]